jgi:hypothetical protein
VPNKAFDLFKFILKRFHGRELFLQRGLACLEGLLDLRHITPTLRAAE